MTSSGTIAGLAALILAAGTGQGRAESLVAARTIPAHSVITVADLSVSEKDHAGAATDPAEVIGLETRTALYRGSPVMPDRLGPPAAVSRNQAVVLVYKSGSLSILAKGRALDRGAPGETVRAMNAVSRAHLAGIVQADGSILVLP
jgi:flagella basal body P-ring formation protein FlgA